MKSKYPGYTLTEALVVVFILGLLATLSLIPLNNALRKARDTKRKSDIQTIGRFITASCYLPDAGSGAYDLNDLIAELKVKYPEQKIAVASLSDPNFKNRSDSGYTYLVNDQKKCAVYANLENDNEAITLNTGTLAPGGGSGVLRGDTAGVNGTLIYFQISN